MQKQMYEIFKKIFFSVDTKNFKFILHDMLWFTFPGNWGEGPDRQSRERYVVLNIYLYILVMRPSYICCIPVKVVLFVSKIKRALKISDLGRQR